MKIDSHHHFWDYSAEQYGWISDEMAILKNDFGPTQLEEVTSPFEITGVVSVQARQTIQETEWLLGIAEQSDLVRGVVGWLPLAAPDAREYISRFSSADYFKGARHVIQDEPDDAFILGDAFNAGVACLKDFDLVYDILIFAKHLENTITFVDQHPAQRFVLDHIAKPTIAENQFDELWKTHIQELAKRPNVDCKFSGVVTEVRDPDWNIETVRPYWETAWEAFGPKRMMFGSDWPVCLLRSQYDSWVTTVQQLSSELSDAESTAFWGGNAIRAYKL